MPPQSRNDCILCHGSGFVIVRGSTDGNEWKCECNHDGTLSPFRDGRPHITITYGEPVASASETDDIKEFRRDSEVLIRLIELVKAMDLQAQREVKVEGTEEVIVGYKFNTGLWHRVLGTIAGHACAKWIQTPEGQARVREAADRAKATIEELDKARAIDWSKYNGRSFT